MAQKKATATKETEVVETKKEFDLDKKVLVKNLAPWSVYLPCLTSSGDISIQASSSARIKRDEIIEQANANIKLFTGIDGNGSHATLYIEDADTREYVEFDSPDGDYKQQVMSDELVKEMFAITTDRAFEKAVKETVITRAEKAFMLSAIERLKLNDYRKIKFCQEYCKFKLR